MTALLKLRDYQDQCLTSFQEAYAKGGQRLAAVLPTGAGKTVIFAHKAERHLTAHPGERVVVLVHTDELVNQAVKKIKDVAPHRSVGIVKAERNEVQAQVIVASVQSLRSAKRRAMLRSVGLVIVDECHHATAPTYRKIMEDLGCFGGRCLAAGFTATLVRGDKAKLSEVWEDVAFRKDIAFMIRRGYLLDVKGKRVEVPELDLTKVRTSGGDYQEGALGEALVESFAPEIVAQAYIEHAKDRQGVLFAPTVAAAYAFAEAFNAEGIVAEVVHGAIGREERRGILARLESGETQVVSNCMVLTEGFDNPKISCAVIARPTKSAGLYQQMVGRVLRPDLTLPQSERGHALILDVVGISKRHDLRSLVDLSSREDLQDKDLDEDLSLLELEDLIEDEELEETGAFLPEDFYRGPVETADFDPLARDSKKLWGRTEDGHYWTSAGADRYVLLSESLEGDPGTFDVVWCAKDQAEWARVHPRKPAAGMTEHKGLPFEMALSWAEEVAIELGGAGAKTLAAKSSRWRKEPPSSAQLWKARSLGVAVPMQEDAVTPIWTRGEVSYAIDSVQASRRIDRLVAAVMASRAK